jgi:hypothetical protein
MLVEINTVAVLNPVVAYKKNEYPKHTPGKEIIFGEVESLYYEMQFESVLGIGSGENKYFKETISHVVIVMLGEGSYMPTTSSSSQLS